MTMVAKSCLLPEEDPELRRWLMAAALVTAAHGGLVLWLMNKHDANLRPATGGDYDRACACGRRASNGDAPRNHAGTANDTDRPRRSRTPQAVAVPELPAPNRGGFDDPAEAKTEAEKNRAGNAEARGETDARAARAAHQRARTATASKSRSLAGLERDGGRRFPQRVVGGHGLEPALPRGGAGPEKAQSPRPHDWPQRPRHVGAYRQQLRIRRPRPSRPRDGAERQRTAVAAGDGIKRQSHRAGQVQHKIEGERQDKRAKTLYGRVRL